MLEPATFSIVWCNVKLQKAVPGRGEMSKVTWLRCAIRYGEPSLGDFARAGGGTVPNPFLMGAGDLWLRVSVVADCSCGSYIVRRALDRGRK